MNLFLFEKQKNTKLEVLYLLYFTKNIMKLKIMSLDTASSWSCVEQIINFWYQEKNSEILNRYCLVKWSCLVKYSQEAINYLIRFRIWCSWRINLVLCHSSRHKQSAFVANNIILKSCFPLRIFMAFISRAIWAICWKF